MTSGALAYCTRQVLFQHTSNWRMSLGNHSNSSRRELFSLGSDFLVIPELRKKYEERFHGKQQKLTLILFPYKKQQQLHLKNIETKSRQCSPYLPGHDRAR